MKYLVTIRLGSDGSHYNIKKETVDADSHKHAYLVASGRYDMRGIVLSTERRGA